MDHREHHIDQDGSGEDAVAGAEKSRVWMAGDEHTVRLTNSVVLAAMEVVEAHHVRVVATESRASYGN